MEVEEELQFKENGRLSEWWGYSNYYCEPPNGGSKIHLPYTSEPPHGDSYHQLIIDSKKIRGYVWCGYLLWSICGRYFTCDWLEGMKGYLRELDGAWVSTETQRATVIIDTQSLRYKILLDPSYSELHKLIIDDKENELWNTLLEEDNFKWEKFR